MKGRDRHSENPRSGAYLNTPVHPELLKALKHEVIDSDITIAEVIHDFLCARFNRPDLAEQIPIRRRVPVPS